MILSQSDIRKAVQENRIAFDPPLEDYQFTEASIDLRLGFCFFNLREDLHGVKVSLANEIKTLADADFSRKIELKEKNKFGQPETFTLESGKFVLTMTHEEVIVPRDMIARVEGWSTYARVGLSVHQRRRGFSWVGKGKLL